MHESMNQNESMHEWMNQSMNEWINEWYSFTKFIVSLKTKRLNKQTEDNTKWLSLGVVVVVVDDDDDDDIVADWFVYCSGSNTITNANTKWIM